MACGCENCDDFCTSEVTCVDANFTNLAVSADAGLNEVLEAIDEALVSVKGDTGDTGVKGDTGDTGATGARGNAGANSVIWSNDGIDHNSNGGFDFDFANFVDVTEINLNKTSKTGYTGVNGIGDNAEEWLDAITVGDMLQVHSVDDSTLFGIYNVVTSPITGNPHKTITVSSLISNGAIPTGLFTVSFVKKGTNGNNGSDATSPVGAIQMYGISGDTPPAGYLWCKGAEVSRTTYADLFAVIGTTFNTGGESASNFRLPNLSGRAAFGWGDAATPFEVVGSTGGTEEETIGVTNLPAHSHPINDPGHSHQYAVNTGGSSGNTTAQQTNAFGTTFLPSTTEETTGITATEDGPTGPTGIAMNNLPPYLVLSFIIKY